MHVVYIILHAIIASLSYIILVSGRKGIYVGTSGLQIAYVSGIQATAAKKVVRL